RTNVTEPEEPQLIEAVAGAREDAFAGDPEALRRTVEVLAELGGVNRAAMMRVDDDAKRLGNAGAWAVVFLALSALGLSVAVVGRLRRRVVKPLERIHAVVTDEHRERRCHVVGGPRELVRIGKEVDRLLDDWERIDRSTRIPAGGPERQLLLALLDVWERPTVIADGGGNLVAANRAAQELLFGEQGADLRGLLGKAVAGEPGSPRFSSVTLASEGYRLCTIETACPEEGQRP
ncbi:MAG TPA: hypothetical protein VM285_17090, partial [Polyangia bacterium]|nr:hypothetical protein [Polyangia bacterium]